MSAEGDVPVGPPAGALTRPSGAVLAWLSACSDLMSEVIGYRVEVRLVRSTPLALDKKGEGECLGGAGPSLEGGAFSSSGGASGFSGRRSDLLAGATRTLRESFGKGSPATNMTAGSPTPESGSSRPSKGVRRKRKVKS